MKTKLMTRNITRGLLALSLASSLAMGTANAQQQPSAKVTAKTSSTVLIPETTGTGDWVNVLTNNIKTANNKDLFITAAFEVGLYTRAADLPDASARAGVQVRVLRDGQVVEPGVITYGRRIQTVKGLQPTDLILDTLEAASFSFVDVDVPVGVHSITVQARVDTGGVPDFAAFGLVGKGTLTVESVRLIKGEDVVLLN